MKSWTKIIEWDERKDLILLSYRENELEKWKPLWQKHIICIQNKTGINNRYMQLRTYTLKMLVNIVDYRYLIIITPYRLSIMKKNVVHFHLLSLNSSAKYFIFIHMRKSLINLDSEQSFLGRILVLKWVFKGPKSFNSQITHLAIASASSVRHTFTSDAFPYISDQC